MKADDFPQVWDNMRIRSYGEVAYWFLQAHADRIVATLGTGNKDDKKLAEWLKDWNDKRKNAVAVKAECDERRRKAFGKKSDRDDERICDGDCNECEATENLQVALLINVLANIFGDEVCVITNSICPNMTVCPECRIDDFCHVGRDGGIHYTGEKFEPSCRIESETAKSLKKYRKSKKK